MGGENSPSNRVNSFRALKQDGDETVVHDSAQALLTFQKLYGTFPRIVGKGDCAGVRLELIRKTHKLIN